MQQAHRDVDLYQSCAFRAQEKKKKKLAPGKNRLYFARAA